MIYKPAVLCLLFLVLSTSASHRFDAPSPSRAQSAYQKGRTAFDKNDYVEAIADFSEAIRLDPNNARTYVWRGFVYDRKRESDKALADYAEAIRLDPKNSEAFAFRGSTHYDKGDFDKAIADYTDALRLDPKAANAFQSRGLAYLSRGEYDKAIADYTAAIRFDPKCPGAVCGRGCAHERKGEIKDAIADLTEAIRVDPKDSIAFVNRGDAQLDDGKFDLAIADYTEAIRLDPKAENAFDSRARAYLSSGENDKAIADFTDVIRLDPKYPYAISNRGVAHARKGDHQAAVADFTEAIRLNPKDAGAFHGRGLSRGKRGEYNQAIADFTEAIRLDPKYSDAYYERGLSQDRKGNANDAITDYTDAIRLNPKDAGAFHGRGLSRGKRGEYNQAIADFTEAIRLDPENSQSFYSRGLAHELQGEHEAAIADYSEAIRLDPKYSDAWFNRGHTYSDMGKLSEALSDFSEAIRLDPKDSSAFDHRGRVHASKNENREALSDYTEAIRLNPTRAATYYARGRIYFETGKPEEAIGDLTQSIRLDPKDSNAFYGRGMAYGRKQDWNKAIEDYSESIRLNAKFADAFSHRSDAYHRLNAIVKAIADLDSAIALTPNNFLYLESRGALRIEHGDYDGGAADLRAAIALDPQDPAATFENWPKKPLTAEALRRGEEQVQRMLQDRPVMAKHGEKARALCQWAARKFAGEDVGQEIRWNGSEPPRAPSDCNPPDNGEPGRIRLRKTAFDGPDTGKEQSFEELWRCAVFELYNVAGGEGFRRVCDAASHGKLTKDQFVTEMATVESMAAEKTRSFCIHIYLPWAREAHESTKATLWYIARRTDCRQKLMLPVDRHTSYWNDYADWYESVALDALTGNSEKADAFVQNLKNQAVTNEEKADVLVYCGNEYQQAQATPDRALACFDEAIRLNPKNVQAHIGRGKIIWCLRGHGVDDAIKEFDEAIRLDPASADAFRERAEIYYMQLLNHSDHPDGDFDKLAAKALAGFGEAIRLNSTDVVALVERGVVYEKKRDFEKALADESEAIRIDPRNLDAYFQRSQIYREKGDARKTDADAAELRRLSQGIGNGKGTDAASVIRPLDVLAVFMPHGLPDQPLNGAYLVEPEGNLFLPYYGRLKVAGMTRQQAENAVQKWVAQFVPRPELLVKCAGRAKWRSGRTPAIPYRIGPDDCLKILAMIRPEEPIDGEFRVASDGAVQLGKNYGKVALKGLTLDEAEKAVRKQLEKFSPDMASVTLAGWEPEQKIDPLPKAAELAEAYFRTGENIRLAAYSALDDPEIVKRIGLTDSQKRTLLRAMAENDLNSNWAMRGSKEARKRVEAVLTPRQLQELKELSLLKLAPLYLKDAEALKSILSESGTGRLAEVTRRRDELDDEKAQRLKLLTPAELQRLREQIDGNDW